VKYFGLIRDLLAVIFKDVVPTMLNAHTVVVIMKYEKANYNLSVFMKHNIAWYL
jgi:hypothetical protein